MKKLFLLMVGAMLMIACEGPMGPQGEPGFSNWKIVPFEVRASDWQYSQDGGFICIFDNFRELDDYIYRDGLVTVYWIKNPGTSNEVKTPLNNSRPYIDQYGEWTESYTYDYAPGSIAFYLTYGNLPSSAEPRYAKFEVVLNW